MSAQVSCPVFRCPKTSISPCTGHRRPCERYFCSTHSRGTLCDRCEIRKQGEMASSYGGMLRDLERRAYSASRSVGVTSLFVISLLLLGVAVIWVVRRDNQSSIPVFVFLLGGGFVGLFGSLLWYVTKAREYMRAESVELDLRYPGFFDYFQQWQAKIDKITKPGLLP